MIFTISYGEEHVDEIGDDQAADQRQHLRGEFQQHLSRVSHRTTDIDKPSKRFARTFDAALFLSLQSDIIILESKRELSRSKRSRKKIRPACKLLPLRLLDV